MSFFDDAYRGTPPWDIGRPQRAFVDLFERQGLPDNPVLDVGCGTGENALYLAAKGLSVTGVDTSALAVQKAKRKAKARDLEATFLVWDALDLAAMHLRFGTVIDSGLFHVFDDEDRKRYANQIAAVLRPRGTYVMMCFSEKEPADWGGPRRVRKEEIRATFTPPRFRVRAIRATRFETNFHPDGGHAYLTTVVRV